MSENRLDRKFNAFVDRLVERVPVRIRLLGIRFSASHLGWHLCLILVTIRDALLGLFIHFRSENDMEHLLSDTGEELDARFSDLRQRVISAGQWLLAIDEAGISLRFSSYLFLLMLAVCGTAQRISGELAGICAFSGLTFVTLALDMNYRPISAGIHQRYLVARVIESFAYIGPLIAYDRKYRMFGSVNNVLLQSSMVFMLITHLFLFLILVAPNRRQPGVLRILALILGILPSITVASAVSYSATLLGSGMNGAVNAVIRISGIILLFVSNRLEMLFGLGAVRLKYSSFWMWFGSTIGLFLLILAGFTTGL